MTLFLLQIEVPLHLLQLVRRTRHLQVSDSAELLLGHALEEREFDQELFDEGDVGVLVRSKDAGAGFVRHHALLV